MTAKGNMRKETKQTLISLSLAGAIGYYLYNKLTESGFDFSFCKKNFETAEERTKRDLAWTQNGEPEFIDVDDVYMPIEEEPVVEDVFEDIIEEPVEEIEEELEEEIIIEEEPVVEEPVEEEPEEMQMDDLLGSDLDMNDDFDMPSLDMPELDEPDLNLDDLMGGAEEPVLEPEEEIDELDEFRGEIDLDNFDDDDEDMSLTNATDLLNAVENKPLMENTEPLHKIDPSDAGTKKEFKNIMDFFSENGLV